mmetsp:Transcript_5610/g.13520  ORF Transcript_5610/g.13520 Transcript_5610/m.13520 type:complete len:228 (+) Transcript_5610:174-857(+)
MYGLPPRHGSVHSMTFDDNKMVYNTPDTAVSVSTNEMEEERSRCAAASSREASIAGPNKFRKRVPKPGHYPAGFSPYRLDVRSSLVVPLSSLDAKQDLLLIENGFKEEFKSTYFDEIDASGPLSPSAETQKIEIHASIPSGSVCHKRRRTCNVAPMTKAEETRQLRAALQASLASSQHHSPSFSGEGFPAGRRSSSCSSSETQLSPRTCRLLQTTRALEQRALPQPA